MIEAYVLVTAPAERAHGLRVEPQPDGALAVTRFGLGDQHTTIIAAADATLFTQVLWALGIPGVLPEPSPTASDPAPNTDRASA